MRAASALCATVTLSSAELALRSACSLHDFARFVGEEKFSGEASHAEIKTGRADDSGRIGDYRS